MKMIASGTTKNNPSHATPGSTSAVPRSLARRLASTGLDAPGSGTGAREAASPLTLAAQLLPTLQILVAEGPAEVQQLLELVDDLLVGVDRRVAEDVR